MRTEKINLGILTLSAFWMAFFSLATCSQAATVYHQTFRHPETAPGEGNNWPLTSTSTGWKAYYGSTAKDISSNNAGVNHSALVGWVNGAPSTEGPGYLYTRDTNATATNRSYILTSEVLANPLQTSAGALTASFYGNISHENMGVYLLMKMDGSWYVTASDLALPIGTQNSISSAASLASMLRTVELGGNDSQWRQFLFVPESGYGVGAPIESPLSGEITQVGFFVTNPNLSSGNTLIARLDSLKISQVPEPSRMLLFLVGAVLMVMKRRRV